MLMTLGVCISAKSIQSCPVLCDTMDYSLPGSSVHGIFQARNIGMGFHFLLWVIFLNQGSKMSLLHWQADSLPLSHQGSTNGQRSLVGYVVHGIEKESDMT